MGKSGTGFLIYLFSVRSTSIESGQTLLEKRSHDQWRGDANGRKQPAGRQSLSVTEQHLSDRFQPRIGTPWSGTSGCGKGSLPAGEMCTAGILIQQYPDPNIQKRIFYS